MIDSELNSELNKIIEDAYSLYMPQIREEITELSKFVLENTPLKDGNPITILEIGTKFGGTFFIWNNINPNGKNISIDVNDGGIHGGIGDEKMDERDEWFKARFSNCEFIRGNSHDLLTLVDATVSIYQPEIEIDAGGAFTTKTANDFGVDFLFIDGDHTFEGVKSDFEAYSPLVKPGGIIAFHDIVISDNHHNRDVYVGEFWNTLKASGQYQLKELVYGDGTWGGIGIVIS